ncbi:MAG: cyclic nucleotide-binding domain-containing protein [Candidatus Sericytochromatia bacterium]
MSENGINDLISTLKSLHIFKNLENDEIMEIMKISQIKKYEKESIIFSEGDDKEFSLFVIIDGRVEITAKSEKTKDEISLFYAGKGLTFGEMSFLDEQPRSATIKTIEDTRVFVITRKFFNILLETNPKVSAKLIIGLATILSRRLRATDQKLKYSI